LQLVEQHQHFERVRDQLFACVDEMRRVRVVDVHTLGLKLGQLDSARSVEATLRQQVEQLHQELAVVRSDCIRHETESAGQRRDIQELKAEARARQQKHQAELDSVEKLLDERDADARAAKRKLTDLTFEHEDVKLQLRDCKAEVAMLRAELGGYQQEAKMHERHSSQVQQDADGARRQMSKQNHTLLGKVGSSRWWWRWRWWWLWRRRWWWEWVRRRRCTTAAARSVIWVVWVTCIAIIDWLADGLRIAGMSESLRFDALAAAVLSLLPRLAFSYFLLFFFCPVSCRWRHWSSGCGRSTRKLSCSAGRCATCAWR
jgi:hypothetical protein